MSNTEIYRERAIALLKQECKSARVRKEEALLRKWDHISQYERGREDGLINYEHLLWLMPLQEEAPSKDDAPDSNTRFIELHPPYPGAVWTGSCRGSLYSGCNTVERSIGQEVVSHRVHNYYEITSDEASLQDYWVALMWTIPDDFKEWTPDNSMIIDFRTESGTYLNAHVSVKIYKAGWASGLSESCHNTNTDWTVIVMKPGDIKGWKSGDVMEIYLHLASRNDYYARVGSIRFNYLVKD